MKSNKGSVAEINRKSENRPSLIEASKANIMG